MTKPKLHPNQRYGRRLSSEQAAAVRREHATGKTSMCEIARRLGVAHSTIRMIISGRTYRP